MTASPGQAIAEFLVDAGVKQKTFCNDPGPVSCPLCGRQSEATYYEFMYPRPWFRVDTCRRCIDLQTVEEDRLYDQEQADEWTRHTLGKSGLLAAELAYDAKWMDARMKGIHFAGDKVTPEERNLPVWRYVHGLPGTGTTAQIALAVRFYIARRRKRAVMVSMSSMLASIRKGFNSDGGSTVDDYCTVPLLAIDKFGIGVGKQWGGDTIAHILNERKRALRPTLIASTMPLGGGEGRTIENHPLLQDGLVAAAIFSQCVGMRGIVHLTKQHRPAMSTRQQTTYQQRLSGGQAARQQHGGRVKTQWQGNDPSPI